LHSKLLFSSVTSISIARVSVGSVRDVGSLNWLAGGLGDLVLDWRAGDLCDGVAVLHLDRDQLDLGVVNAVLGGDLTASMLHSCLDRVGYSVSNWGNSWDRVNNRCWDMVGNNRSCYVMYNVNRSRERSMSNISTIVGICFSICLSLPFVKSVVSLRSITDSVHHLLAQLLVLDLLGVHSLLAANILSCGGAGLCCQDHICYFAVRCRYR